jgi:cyclohexyl-isocyanide hydratase
MTEIAIPIYEGFTPLDAIGPYEVLARLPEQGKAITAAGVSAGIDMALLLASRLAGEQAAQAMQLVIEYDPQPPFQAGSADKAPPEVVELLRARAAARPG